MDDFIPDPPPRHELLNVALGGSAYQAAIDAGKHGTVRRDGGVISAQQILYGKRENIITVVVTPNSSRERLLKRWYSVKPLKLMDLILDIESPIIVKDMQTVLSIPDENGITAIAAMYILYIDPLKMDLFSVTQKDLKIFLNTAGIREKPEICPTPTHLHTRQYKDTSQIPSSCFRICVASLKYRSLLTTVRRGVNVVRNEFMEIKGPSETRFDGTELGTVYSIFKGSVIEEVLCEVPLDVSEDIFCTDTERNIKVLGRVETMAIYAKHLTGGNLDAIIGTVLCSHREVLAYDFATVINTSVFRALTIEEQRAVLKQACIGRKTERVQDVLEASVFLGCYSSIKK